MLKTFKYRLYPTRSQITLIDKHCGAVRFIYNQALETKQRLYNTDKTILSVFDLHKQLVKLKAEYTWLKEINSQSLQQSITNLDKAYILFFNGKNSFPTFKKKSTYNKFTIPQHIKITNDKLYIPKFRSGILINIHRPFIGVIKRVVISKTNTDKYFAAILCETHEVTKESSSINYDTSIGIDLGIKNFITTSSGEFVHNPKFLYSVQSKINYLNRHYSVHKGKKVKRKLRVLHEKTTNRRLDFLHKVSINLIKNHDSICIETLQIANMLKTKQLSGLIADAGWGMFINMLEYKAKWYGKNIIKIGKFDPSSKTCSCCGNINNDLQLKDRTWICASCGKTHDRDINAAINIKNFAIKTKCLE